MILESTIKEKVPYQDFKTFIQNELNIEPSNGYLNTFDRINNKLQTGELKDENFDEKISNFVKWQIFAFDKLLRLTFFPKPK